MDNDRSSRQLTLFARMALATTIATYTLILVGALVRAAGAGLGCPDWPRCFGQWIPPLQASQLPPGFDPAQFNAALTWLEYTNRLLGVTIGLLIVATLFMAWRWHRRRPRLFWPSLAATLLVAYQGWLGGQVVRSGLEPWMITAHMVLALVIVTLLLYATWHARLQAAGYPRSTDPDRARLRRWIAVTFVVVLLQIGLGTQVRAAMEHAVDLDPDLPRAEWIDHVGWLDPVHKSFSWAPLLLTFGLRVYARRRFRGDRGLVRAADASFALVIFQILIGTSLVYTGMPAASQVVHLSGASLLVGTLTLLALQTQREPVVREWTAPATGHPAAPDPSGA